MADLVLYPMRRRLKGSFPLLPEFLERIKKFDGLAWCDNLAERFEGSFCKDDDLMLGVALMDEGHMRGHVVAGVELLLGKATVMVYQFHKDKGFDDSPDSTNTELERMLEGWALSLMTSRNLDIRHISMACKDEARERLFERFGYTKGPRLMRKEIGHG